MAMRSVLMWSAATIVLVAGCAQTPQPEKSFHDVAQNVKQRTGQDAVWKQSQQDWENADREVDRLLKSPLSTDDAVRIALLSNASLQAEYEGLGIAYGEFIQAGTLSNPSIDVAAKIPVRGG